MRPHGLLAIMALLASVAFAQEDSLRVVILSDRVGAEIDTDERERFSLFGQVDGFLAATVVARSDSTFEVVMRARGPNGTVESKHVRYPLPLLLRMAEKIDHLEEIEAGSYVWGSHPASLRMMDGSTIGWNDIVTPTPGATTTRNIWLPDLLPFAHNRPPSVPDQGWRLRFSAGLSSSPGDLQAIQQAITSVEDYYRDQGYPVTNATIDKSVGALLWLGLGIDLPKGFGLMVETGSSLAKELTWHLTDLMLIYRADLTGSGRLRLSLGGGYMLSSFKYETTIPYNVRISPVNSSDGSYTLLESLVVGGTDTESGLVGQAGVEFYPTDWHDLAIGLCARYHRPGPYTLNLPYGTNRIPPREIDLSGVFITLSISVVL